MGKFMEYVLAVVLIVMIIAVGSVFINEVSEASAGLFHHLITVFEKAIFARDPAYIFQAVLIAAFIGWVVRRFQNMKRGGKR